MDKKELLERIKATQSTVDFYALKSEIIEHLMADNDAKRKKDKE